MEKRTLYAAVFVVVLGLIAFAALRAPDKGEHTGPAPRAFPVIKAADIVRLEITSQKDEQTTLEKKDGAWRIIAPSAWPADPQAVKTLTDAIEKLSFGDVVTENAAKHAELGVPDKGSARLKVVTAAQSPEFLLGQTLAGFTMLRLAGKNEVWQATGLQIFAVNKASKDWRDHAVVQLSGADIDKLTIEADGAKLTVEKLPEAAPVAGAAPKKEAPKWKIVDSSAGGPKDGDFDTSQPTTVAQALAQLRAFDFAEGKSAQDAGLEPPALTITASAKGKTEVIQIGAQQGEDFYVRRGGDPTIYQVKKYLLDHAAARPIDYRDKTLLRYKVDEIARLRVVQGKDDLSLSQKDGKWALPSGAVDETKAKALLAGVETLIGTSFVTDKSFKPELDKPRATITVETKSGHTTLKIGALTKDNAEYFVAIEGRKDVLVAKKYAIDRLLKKPADLAASPPKK